MAPSQAPVEYFDDLVDALAEEDLVGLGLFAALAAARPNDAAEVAAIRVLWARQRERWARPPEAPIEVTLRVERRHDGLRVSAESGEDERAEQEGILAPNGALAYAMEHLAGDPADAGLAAQLGVALGARVFRGAVGGLVDRARGRATEGGRPLAVVLDLDEDCARWPWELCCRPESHAFFAADPDVWWVRRQHGDGRPEVPARPTPPRLLLLAGEDAAPWEARMRTLWDPEGVVERWASKGDAPFPRCTVCHVRAPGEPAEDGLAARMGGQVAVAAWLDRFAGAAGPQATAEAGARLASAGIPHVIVAGPWLDEDARAGAESAWHQAFLAHGNPLAATARARQVLAGAGGCRFADLVHTVTGGLR
jgi:hypothetical protein